MRHRINNQSFGRKQGPKKALFRGLVQSLVEHERIRTTVTKAKAVRSQVEKAITTGKKGTVHAQRTLLAKYPNQTSVSKIMKNLAPRFKDRNGGYTRIVKVGYRPGDKADMALLEFVDYKLPQAGADETVAGSKTSRKDERAAQCKKDDQRKNLRKIQSESRRKNR